MEERKCEARDCPRNFVVKRKTQKYCSRFCREAEDNARRRKTVPEDAQSLDEALHASRERDHARAHRQELREALQREQRMRRYLEVLRECVTAYEPTPLVVDLKELKKAPEHELLLPTGDWHTGLKVQIHETGGLYEQTVETTRQQVFKMWNRLERLTELQRSARKINKLHIISLGDLIEHDDMRPSQHRKVEDVVTVQTIQAFDLVCWFIRQCLTIFPEVYIDAVGGNHDRTSNNRRGNAGLGEQDYIDTYSWLLIEFAKRVFENEPRVKIRNWQTFFGYKRIAGQKVVFEHGSSFRWNANSYGGIPWYTVAMLPHKYRAMLGGADLTVIGHGHRPAILPDGRGWMVANGAFPGTSTFEQSSFKSIHRPLQWLMSLHKEYGLTGWEPIYLDVPGMPLPGVVWEDPEHWAEMANQSRV